MHQRFFAASRFGPWETGTFETDVKFDRKKKSKTRGGKKRHIMSSTSSSKYQMSLTNVETVEFVLNRGIASESKNPGRMIAMDFITNVF